MHYNLCFIETAPGLAQRAFELCLGRKAEEGPVQTGGREVAQGTCSMRFWTTDLPLSYYSNRPWFRSADVVVFCITSETPHEDVQNLFDMIRFSLHNYAKKYLVVSLNGPLAKHSHDMYDLVETSVDPLTPETVDDFLQSVEEILLRHASPNPVPRRPMTVCPNCRHAW